MQNFHCSLYSHKVIISKNVHWRWSVTVVFHSDQAFPLFSRSHAIICFVNPTLRTDCNLFHCVNCVTFQTQVLTLLQAAAVLYWPASQYLCTLPSNTDVLTSAQVHSVPGKIRMNERKAGPLPPIIWNIIKVFLDALASLELVIRVTGSPIFSWDIGLISKQDFQTSRP